MNVTCPHCKDEIKLVEPKDLRQEFKIGPSMVIAASKEGKFPQPWIAFGNRKVYLRDEIEEYAKKKEREKFDRIPPEELLRHLDELIDSLEPAAREQLRKRLSIDDTREGIAPGGG